MPASGARDKVALVVDDGRLILVELLKGPGEVGVRCLSGEVPVAQVPSEVRRPFEVRCPHERQA